MGLQMCSEIKQGSAGCALKLNGTTVWILQLGKLLDILCCCSRTLARLSDWVETAAVPHSWVELETVFDAGLMSHLPGQVGSQAMIPYWVESLAQLPA